MSYTTTETRFYDLADCVLSEADQAWYSLIEWKEQTGDSLPIEEYNCVDWDNPDDIVSFWKWFRVRKMQVKADY
jgi:hypothetical protein